MHDKNQISALISLLDDGDKEVFEHVFDKLASLGPSVIPTLEDAWNEKRDELHHERLEELIHTIQFEGLVSDFAKWAKSSQPDLLEGCWLIARHLFPDLTLLDIKQSLARIKQDIWIELNDRLTPFEQINVFNQVFYKLNKFHGKASQSKDARKYCINHVLDCKEGNSLSLGLIYLIIAQQLDLPAYGVTLPNHFVLAIGKEPIMDNEELKKKRSKVLFYVNPLTEGSIFSRNEIKQFLNRMQLEPKIEYFVPSNNRRLIGELLATLKEVYGLENNHQRVDEMNQLAACLEER